jgi:hypothetical protein
MSGPKLMGLYGWSRPIEKTEGRQPVTDGEHERPAVPAGSSPLPLFGSAAAEPSVGGESSPVISSTYPTSPCGFCAIASPCYTIEDKGL